MGRTVDDTALDTLFREARSYTKWQPRPVSDQTLRDLYELLKWAPTSANGEPARFAFLRSTESKERLRPALAPLNIEKTMTAKSPGGSVGNAALAEERHGWSGAAQWRKDTPLRELQ